MKKLLALVLAVVMMVGLAGCSSGISQEDYDKVVAERDALQEENRQLGVELVEQALETTVDDYSFARADSLSVLIDRNAFCTILNESIVQITVPSYAGSAEDFYAVFEKQIDTIISIMSSVERDKCIIILLDDSGLCKFGVSLTNSGESRVFAGVN